MNGRKTAIAAILIFLSRSPLLAQQTAKPAPARLSVERIYKDYEFEAQGAQVEWMTEGSDYLSWEDSKETPGTRDLVRHNPANDHTEILIPGALLIPPKGHRPLAVERYWLSKDGARLLIFTNSRRVWRQNTRGDFWVLDRAARELKKLGGDAAPSSLMHAKLAPVGPRVAYVRDNNLHVEDLRDGRITALSHSKSPDEINGTFDWVYEEEFSLRDGFRWSPDGQRIAYWQLDTSGMREYPLVNNTDSLYPRITPVKYPKVGERNAAARVGIASADGGPTHWLSFDDPRENYLAYAEWVGSSELLLQRFNRRQNAVDVVEAHGQQMALLPILHDEDKTWIDLQDNLPWLENRRAFLWLSERDGWRHIFLASLAEGTLRLITPGAFDVIQIVGLDRKSDQVYFTASPENATQKYLYRASLNAPGQGPERLTPRDQPGTHDYDLSPDARWAVHQYSTANSPPVFELIRLPSHERVKVLADNAELKKKLAELEPVKTEFFKVDIGGGVVLDAWCMLPPHLDPHSRYPLLVHVYGEPAGQTVLDRWGRDNGLWHRMLAERGYVVMSFDNRGTPAPKGRDWRKAVFHKVGILAPQEQAAAVRAVLRERPYLDPKRVGVWGWSGGGSMTLNAMLKFPDLYLTGISIAPVANQRLYDTIYQERYMGLPGDNPEGFIQGSPISFAHQLKGNLLIIHGTGDDNCHYQGTEAIINEFIRLDKPFTMMAYPNRSHSISEGTNTTLHLRHLMTRYLEEHLPPGPRPAQGKP